MAEPDSKTPTRRNPAAGLDEDDDFSIDALRSGKTSAPAQQPDLAKLRQVSEDSGFPSREAPKPRAAKAKKVEMRQRTFTVPVDEDQVVAATQQRLIELGYPIKDVSNESWIARLAFLLLEDADSATLKAAAERRPPLKRGAPSGAKKRG